MKLEEQIQQMRDPDYQAPSVLLHDPHSLSHTQIGMASTSASASASLSASASGLGAFQPQPQPYYTGPYAYSTSSSSSSAAGSPSSTGLSVAASPYGGFGELYHSFDLFFCVLGSDGV